VQKLVSLLTVADLLCAFHADQGAVHLGVQVINVLLLHGANINATDEDGQTPLQYALLCDHQQVNSSCYQRNFMCIVSQLSVVQGLTSTL
jgi:ankyrin repeat protein